MRPKDIIKGSKWKPNSNIDIVVEVVGYTRGRAAVKIKWPDGRVTIARCDRFGAENKKGLTKLS
jgi:hypothetical protein